MKFLGKALVVFLSFFTLLQAQENQEYLGENPEQCKEKIAIMTTYYKQNAFDDALPSTRILMETCPQGSKNLYIIGERIYKEKLKEVEKSNPDLKEGYVDTLLWLYDKRMQYFVDNEKDKADILLKKGALLGHYRTKDSLEVAYGILKNLLTNHPEVFSPYEIQIFMFNAKFMLATKKMDCEEMIENYFSIADIAANQEEKKAKAYEKVMDKVVEYSDRCLDCELLDSVYLAKFDLNKADEKWLDKGIKLLTDKRCSSSDALLKMMEARIETQPDAKTANILGKYYKANDPEKAQKFFNMAIDLADNEADKVHYLLDKGIFLLSKQNYVQAKNTGEEVLSIQNQNSAALLLVGDAIAYGASGCKDLQFGSKEVYWVAVDYYNRAAAAAATEGDEKNKSKAIKNAANYSQYYPDKGDLFLKSLNDGDSYHVGCWVNKSTRVRAK